MKRTRPGWRFGERQRHLAEKYERLSDYPLPPVFSDDDIDAMGADSFPASDPPSFTVERRRPRDAEP